MPAPSGSGQTPRVPYYGPTNLPICPPRGAWLVRSKWACRRELAQPSQESLPAELPVREAGHLRATMAIGADLVLPLDPNRHLAEAARAGGLGLESPTWSANRLSPIGEGPGQPDRPSRSRLVVLSRAWPRNPDPPPQPLGEPVGASPRDTSPLPAVGHSWKRTLVLYDLCASEGLRDRLEVTTSIPMMAGSRRGTVRPARGSRARWSG